MKSTIDPWIVALALGSFVVTSSVASQEAGISDPSGRTVATDDQTLDDVTITGYRKKKEPQTRPHENPGEPEEVENVQPDESGGEPEKEEEEAPRQAADRCSENEIEVHERTIGHCFTGIALPGGGLNVFRTLGRNWRGLGRKEPWFIGAIGGYYGRTINRDKVTCFDKSTHQTRVLDHIYEYSTENELVFYLPENNPFYPQGDLKSCMLIVGKGLVR